MEKIIKSKLRFFVKMVARLLDGSFTTLVRVSLNWMGWAGLGSGTKSCHGHKRGASGCRSRFGVVYLDVDMQIGRCNANSMCALVTGCCAGVYGCVLRRTWACAC